LLIADLGGVIGFTALMLPGDTSRLRSLHPEQLLPEWIPGSGNLRAQAGQGYGDFLSRIEEFRGPAVVASEIEKRFRASGADFLCLSTYQLTGILSFYAPAVEPLLWLPDHGRTRFPWINDQAWKGKTALVAEWPRRGPLYFALFGQLPVAVPAEIAGIGSPVFLSLGRTYKPEFVENP